MDSPSSNFYINHCAFGLILQYGFHTHYLVSYKIELDPAHVKKYDHGLKDKLTTHLT